MQKLKAFYFKLMSALVANGKLYGPDLSQQIFHWFNINSESFIICLNVIQYLTTANHFKALQ